MSAPRLRAAICHASPIFLSATKTTHKAIGLIRQAAKNSANLIVFPETYIPAFPVWSALLAPYACHDFFARMTHESIYADGEELLAIRNEASRAGVLVNMGFSEKSRHSVATLYNSNMLIGTEGEVLVHHRKLVPTFFEKLTWSPGDGAGLKVAKTKFGNIGTLICGENTNPLARYSLMAQAEQVHISTWPGIWPTRAQSTKAKQRSGTDSSTKEHPSSSEPRAESKNYDNIAANRTRSAAHCFEGKCFGIMSAGLLGGDCKREIAINTEDATTTMTQLNAAPQAPSMFFTPTGAALPGFVIDENGVSEDVEYLQHEEDILYADLGLNECIEGKQYHDVTGGYQRLDVFDLRVDRIRRDAVTFSDGP